MIKDNLNQIKASLPNDVELIVVSKFRPLEQLMEVYETGHRQFAENRVQELTTKYESMPKDVLWHMIGHLQSNKVKYIAPFIHLIHSVDSIELATEINKQALKNNRIIPVLLQFHIAQEETKSGFSTDGFQTIIPDLIKMVGIEIQGVMGMASLTDNQEQVFQEFTHLKSIFNSLKNSYFQNHPNFKIISMGMSGDYLIAVKAGSTMVRVGSLVFE
jgi:hypothetical protein